jgi:hypothetical protein
MVVSKSKCDQWMSVSCGHLVHLQYIFKCMLNNVQLWISPLAIKKRGGGSGKVGAKTVTTSRGIHARRQTQLGLSACIRYLLQRDQFFPVNKYAVCSHFAIPVVCGFINRFLNVRSRWEFRNLRWQRLHVPLRQIGQGLARVTIPYWDQRVKDNTYSLTVCNVFVGTVIGQ